MIGGLTSGHMSSSVLQEGTRRRLSERQVEVVQRLVDAAVDELHVSGYDGLSVRNVAKRAGVAPATAYTYFASKDHLVAEALWRRMHGLPSPTASGGRPLDRLTSELDTIGSFMADDAVLAGACTTALLGSGPDVLHLRQRIGAEINHRLAVALGDGGDPAVLRTLELAYTGAMLLAGMGHIAFTDVPVRLREVAELLLEERS